MFLQNIGEFEVKSEPLLFKNGMDLYLVAEYNGENKLFFMSEAMVKELIRYGAVYPGFPEGETYSYFQWQLFREFLSKRKIVFKNCYYDVVYKKK